jgi:hypothetical protein
MLINNTFFHNEYYISYGVDVLSRLTVATISAKYPGSKAPICVSISIFALLCCLMVFITCCFFHIDKFFGITMRNTAASVPKPIALLFVGFGKSRLIFGYGRLWHYIAG